MYSPPSARSPSDSSVTPSKGAEDCRWCQDTPRHCEGILRLASSPQGRPLWRERAHQTLRGICRVNDCRAQLTQAPVAIRRCQRRFKILSRYWKGSNKSLPRRRSTETKRRRSDVLTYPGMLADHSAYLPLTVFAAHWKISRSDRRRCWTRALQFDLWIRGGILGRWQSSLSGFERLLPAIR